MEKKETVEAFEKSVLEALWNCNVDSACTQSLGVAVSGGADSVALLTALARALPHHITPIVITVNHNLREKEETERDARFVQAYCNSLGVHCVCHEIERGAIQCLANERKLGIEEAARAVRYKAFFAFAEKYAVRALCLAHNQNDNIETILMRFLTGGDSRALSGIQKTRALFVRPLLDISRTRIEAYLAALGVSFCTDSTNSDTALFRNRVRHIIIPVLEREVPGWKTAVLSLSKKMYSDDAALRAESERAFQTSLNIQQAHGEASVDKAAFSALSVAVQRRVLYDLAALASGGNDGERLPYTFVERVLQHCKTDGFPDVEWKENAHGIVFFERKMRIFVRKVKKEATEIGFFAIIDRNGLYDVAHLHVMVEQKSDGMSLCAFEDNTKMGAVSIVGLNFPFVFRSRQQGDCIYSANGVQKSLAKIFEGWKCEKKHFIPVIQELKSPETRIVFIWGSLYGEKDYKEIYETQKR